MAEQKLTGYPHIDRPWMKYYSDNFDESQFPHKTIFDYLQENNAENGNKIALTYYGKKITYDQFYLHVEAAAAVLTFLGVKEKDRVLYLLPNIPETAYYFYGGSIIGAVGDYVDPRPDSIDFKVNAKKMLSLIKTEKITHIVTFDQCYPAMIYPIEQDLKNIGIDNILIISATDSMGRKGKADYIKELLYYKGLKNTINKLSHTKKLQKTIEDSIEKTILTIHRNSELFGACDTKQIIRANYYENMLCAIVHTSGTSSSKPKPIPLTHDNLNAYSYSSIWANMPVKVGDNVLHMLPYFAAYGLVSVAHSGLCHGNNLIQIPEFSLNELGKMILKFRPQIIIGTPTWFLALINDPVLKNADLSCLTMITYGGDIMEINDEKMVNRFLSSHGCTVPLTKGHGMSEVSGCSSFANHSYNVLGSMGIPIPGTVYALIDLETKELVKFENNAEFIEGELIISSRAATPGILDGDVIVPHVMYDGMDFIETGDVAQMDKNGVMKFLSRKDRSFTRYDGYKVKVHEVEKLIKQNSQIRYCAVVPYTDDKKMGAMPIAHIVLEDMVDIKEFDKTEFIKRIVLEQFTYNEAASSRQIPSKFRIRKSMSLSKNGKVDFRALISEGIDGTEITVEVQETNLSVEDIKIF